MRATILLAHGSRDPMWRTCVDSLALRMTELDERALVRCAFLEWCAPDLSAVAQELAALGTTEWVVVPLFLGLGKHAREDLPRLMAQLQQVYPHVRIRCRVPVGEEPAVIDLLAKMALS